MNMLNKKNNNHNNYKVTIILDKIMMKITIKMNKWNNIEASKKI